MTELLPDPIARYFEADARRDNDVLIGLFTADAVVVDEDETHHGIAEIRAWREGPAARYEYVTEVFDAKSTSEDSCVVTGRLTGNFPGGTAELTWHFTLAGDRIARLRIAP